ncbi:thiamine phosphate synthase [Lichenihabitans sp. Uapishka_5]|uniref:thiamine phosphate synthase n=1 Tax=Lichenihabitans sp. Uapishka_5 TaxID=3037302 RepID=UPI0029E82667|nr:thiamine phosphate synthase [Lichenihabitans sp. Uapishka_5]MDX7953598.1 thiamine phosphate synthase [Lichenihabitans sp. Uapishka_5]
MIDSARLYLVTPVLDSHEAFAPVLTAALDAAPVDCVLLRLPPHDDGLRRKVATALTPLVQERGAALLIEADTRLAAAVGADGVHVEGAGDDLASALGSMKPARIVGCGRLPDRDAAMEAGETGVDYLMFGDEAEVAPFDERLDRVGWWAEIFQVPCVAMAASLDEVKPLAEASAEFIGLGDALWDDPRGAAAVIAEVAATLAAVAEAKAAALAGS